ncbi:vacuolar sorting-associated protein Vps27, putative [Babesia ovata]|uniref:Vacuolar sorting-associated protein Vps27, putative n=1 Tax=Babesia ovata TaxID=189622 RepID=A0A2H6K744_9APIC|nr:vacuolar sorting-associated protein Vps27, putative [Babesia ovata]GBE58827.1 vacuolar sorting-associated protein Vps27, putative [Babesia ovata]
MEAPCKFPLTGAHSDVADESRTVEVYHLGVVQEQGGALLLGLAVPPEELDLGVRVPEEHNVKIEHMRECVNVLDLQLGDEDVPFPERQRIRIVRVDTDEADRANAAQVGHSEVLAAEVEVLQRNGYARRQGLDSDAYPLDGEFVVSEDASNGVVKTVSVSSVVLSAERHAVVAQELVPYRGRAIPRGVPVTWVDSVLWPVACALMRVYWRVRPEATSGLFAGSPSFRQLHKLAEARHILRDAPRLSHPKRQIASGEAQLRRNSTQQHKTQTHHSY